MRLPLLHDGDHVACAKRLRALLRELPENASALHTLAMCELRFRILEKAAERGFTDPALLLRDTRLASLQADPRFEQLAQRLVSSGQKAVPATPGVTP